MRTFYLVVGAVAAYAAYRYFFADDQDDDRPPSPPQTHEYSQPPVHRPPIRPQTYGYPRTYESPQPPVHRPPSRSQTYEYSRTYEYSQPPVHRPPIRPQTFEYPRTYESSQPPVHRPPSRPQTYESSRTYESSQPPVHRRDERQQRQSIDSSRTDDITPEEAYASLRARAKQEGDLRSQCYQESKKAYKRCDYARAKALSDERKRHERERETLHAEASATIFKENNRDRDACDVDLHGLYVKEAIAYSKRAVSDARRRGYSEIRLIVGQGNHSERGIPRLKPALRKDMQKRGHHVKTDPKNPGVLVVRLGSR